MATKYIKLSPFGSVVHAQVFGDWAAHESHESFGWHVTHVPSGCALWKELDGRRAMRLTKRLNAHGVGESLPDWIVTNDDRKVVGGMLWSERDLNAIFKAAAEAGL